MMIYDDDETMMRRCFRFHLSFSIQSLFFFSFFFKPQASTTRSSLKIENKTNDGGIK